VGNYNVVFTKSAFKEIVRLDSNVYRERILQRIQELSANPRPSGSKKLQGFRDRYRLRQGDFRILYEIQDRILVVTVIQVGNRKEVYR
jgi:mRNA interferase RelE/StbE